MKSRISGKEIRSDYKTYTLKGKEYICIEDVFHLDLMHSLRLTDDEYNKILSKISDEQADILINEKPTFAQKREMVITIKKIFNDEREKINCKRDYLRR